MPPDSSSSNPIRKTKAVPRKSPFFRPSDHDTPDNIHGGSRFFRTPGGTTRRKKNALRKSSGSDKAEHKSTVLDAVSNLVNAIVGAGIVGIPFAIQESGFVPGICLVIFVALMCEKSLRLLIETAKHSNVPSYETVAEAAFGKLGFYFVATNMFILSYGAMMSYLMIVKDSFSSILGIDEDDVLMKRTVLVVVSSLVILPLSCQRDMADLAKTSKMNVCFDVTMVLIVTYLAFCCGGDEMHEKAYYVDYDVISDSSSGAGSAAFATTADETTNDLFKIQWDTIAIGLGVLSFAFVCQHASFIIAGSLENPTKERWSTVSRLGLGFCAFLALLMGISGNLGFAMNGRHVHGDILNSLPEELALSKVAKGLLGTTMLFVYPMESFVARHACVVVLFEGRKAHEGDDASVLNRRDRRITLTVALYLSAVIPAAIFEELGDVLAITGAIGGSCLSYIGPGTVYIGIHGGRFLELSKAFFGRRVNSSTSTDGDEEELAPLASSHDNSDGEKLPADDDGDGCLCQLLKTVLWYLAGMPIWTSLASIGKGSLTTYVTEMALKSPHPIRIGNVRFARAKVLGSDSYTRVVMLQNTNSSSSYNSNNNNNNNKSTRRDLPAAFANASSSPEDSEEESDPHYRRFDSLTTKLMRTDSLPRISKDSSYKMQTTRDGTIVALPPLAFYQPKSNSIRTTTNHQNYQSINQKIGAMAVAAAAADQPQSGAKGDDIAIEDDPQGDPPTPLDFALAIFYVNFGVLAMLTGLASIFL